MLLFGEECLAAASDSKLLPPISHHRGHRDHEGRFEISIMLVLLLMLDSLFQRNSSLVTNYYSYHRAHGGLCPFTAEVAEVAEESDSKWLAIPSGSPQLKSDPARIAPAIQDSPNPSLVLA